MIKQKSSETVTENIFREYYGANTFIEKSAIPSGYGFVSKKGTDYTDLADGTSKLTISQELFKEYYIDYIPYEEQKDFVRTKLKDFLKIQEKYRKAQEQLSQEIINLAK